MIKWDKRFLQKCTEVGVSVTMYSRFKDDIFISALDVEKGTKLEDGKLIVDMQKKTQDENKSDDDVTMEVVRQVAESLDPNLKFEIDVPSYHEDKKIAVLDLKIGLNEEMENRVDFEFYEKPTKNTKVILAESAINAKIK